MSPKVIARVVFGGDLNPDVNAAIAELRQAGYKVERLYPPVLHPLDAFIDVDDEPTSYAEHKAIWAQIDAMAKPYHGLVEQVFGRDWNYIPHLRPVTDCVG